MIRDNTHVIDPAVPGFLSFSLIVLAQLGIVTLLFATASPIVVIGLLLTLILGTAVLMAPRWGLYCIVFVTFVFHADAIGHYFVIPVFGINWYAMDWILFFAFFSWLIQNALGISPPPKKTRLTLPLILFFALLIISTVTGITHGNRFQDVFADLRWFFYYISFFFVLVYARDFKEIERVFWVMLICGTVGAIPEIVGALSSPSFDALTGKKLFFTRIAGYHEVNYPLQLVSSIVVFPFFRTFGKRILLLCSALVSSAALFLSYARGSWLAAVGGVVLTLVVFAPYTITLRGNLLKIISGTSVAAVILVALSLSGSFTFETLSARSLTTVNTIDVSSLQRVTEWQYAWQVFLQHPILGAGLGFIYHFYALGVGPVEQIFLHNSYLYVLSKMGIVGFLGIIYLYASALVLARKSIRTLPHGPEMGLLIAFSSMVIVLLIKSLTTWHLNTLTISLFIGVILGVIGVIHSLASSASRNLSTPEGR